MTSGPRAALAERGVDRGKQEDSGWRKAPLEGMRRPGAVTVHDAVCRRVVWCHQPGGLRAGRPPAIFLSYVFIAPLDALLGAWKLLNRNRVAGGTRRPTPARRG